jgi:hypothetical protein
MSRVSDEEIVSRNNTLQKSPEDFVYDDGLNAGPGPEKK